ncbi:hypothetical protein DPMN_021193 [Dreissena polymorpha]|uniref:Uncharacterized protein n=1 Tax=Dreissena polymorpha TaxID=45954 RepID=A0A9D4NND3_DREPO|nr:hypothetical protein DPMN_021193 [Dreissena polymorpha]
MKRAKLLKGTGIFINEDLTKINAEVLASLRPKEPEMVEKAWSRDGKLFVRYRGQERNKHVTFDKNKLDGKVMANQNLCNKQNNVRPKSVIWQRLKSSNINEQ